MVIHHFKMVMQPCEGDDFHAGHISKLGCMSCMSAPTTNLRVGNGKKTPSKSWMIYHGLW